MDSLVGSDQCLNNSLEAVCIYTLTGHFIRFPVLTRWK